MGRTDLEWMVIESSAFLGGVAGGIGGIYGGYHIGKSLSDYLKLDDFGSGMLSAGTILTVVPTSSVIGMLVGGGVAFGLVLAKYMIIPDKGIMRQIEFESGIEEGKRKPYS